MALCAGVHKLSKQQLEKIQKGINALAEELAAIKIKNFRIRKGYAEMSKTGQNILFFNLFMEIFLKEKRKKIS